MPHRPQVDAVERLKQKLRSVRDADLKRQFILESIINTVGNRVQREMRVITPADAMSALWHQAPNPSKALKQAKRHLLRNPPVEDPMTYKDMKSFFSLVRMILLTLLMYNLRRQHSKRKVRCGDSFPTDGPSHSGLGPIALLTIVEED
ncbi:hypothetical protein SISNIDRAFT_488169 [Sistotremastrum niveocremeum HHB9708]|uniref:Uncharacterized protein n=1 Tax=Sistotremastrum niveocremeum HHB9708 TaxID=1314777 RepID=A0A164RIT9_9AGAM|nr:hypothetical protein SISNIDRAFT_488169 [Sistotremastrum niveocremeum HHB9708]